ncbi:SIMPL domain-containing protein [Oceanobacillus kapialis]|uniref:SIMPL domain-containing protein n=1 Tax=Oceanobacillus kapialis TaxID=481353 RepID=UPI00384C16A2
MYYPFVSTYRQTPPQPRNGLEQTMTVIGNGSVSVAPNMATVEIGVMTENTSLTNAQQTNAAVMNQVIETLLSLGVARENIQTASYTVNPRYDFVDGEQIFRGYQVTNLINVTITDIDQIGRILDAAVEDGANLVNSIQFSVQNSEQYKQQALQEALANAQAKANALATSMQVNLNPIPLRIKEITETPPIPFSKMALSAEAVATPIEPGELVIDAILEVKFQY